MKSPFYLFVSVFLSFLLMPAAWAGDNVTFRINLSQRAEVRITNSQGHLVDQATLEAGTYEASWGGLNRIGRPVGAGTYHLVVNGGKAQGQKHAFRFEGTSTHSRLDFSPIQPTPGKAFAKPVLAHSADREKTKVRGSGQAGRTGAMTVLAGYVHSFSREKPLAGVKVALIDEQGRRFKATTNKHGQYHIAVPLPCDTLVGRLAVHKNGFAPYRSWVALPASEKVQRTDIRLMEPLVHALALNDVFAPGPNRGRPLMANQRRQSTRLWGSYVDKKERPVAEATVTFITEEGVELTSAQTDAQGAFELDLEGLGHPEAEVFRQAPAPNPFRGACSFSLTLEREAVVSITDVNGRLIDKVHTGPGIYKGSWGGLNRQGSQVKPGAYLLHVSSEAGRFHRKLIFRGGASAPLSLSRISGSLKNSGEKAWPQLRFEKPQTSTLVEAIPPVSGDTDAGTFQGNTGPALVAPLADTVEYLMEASLNLNAYFDNDDQSIYSVQGQGFSIESDSLLRLNYQEAGLHGATVLATDPADAALEAAAEVAFAIQDWQGMRLDSAGVQHPATAGEDVTFSALVTSGQAPVEGATLAIQTNAPHVADTTIEIGAMQAYEQRTVGVELSYPQPGAYTGQATLTCPEGEETKSFEAEVAPNPEPQRPVVYDMPDQYMTEGSGDVVTVNLNEYVTDVNGDEIIWDYNNQWDEYINAELNDENIMTFTLVDDEWTGFNEVQPYAFDGSFYEGTKFNISVVPLLNDFSLSANIAQLSTTVTAEGDFNDANFEEFFGVSTSPTMENCNELDQSGCLSYEYDPDVPATASFEASELGLGTHEIYAGFCRDDFYANIESQSLVIQEGTLTAQGQIVDFFTEEPIAGATVIIDGNSGTTDAGGYYELEVVSNAYLETEIRKDGSGYVPRHTWYKYGEVEDFNLLSEDFPWDLYNDGWRRDNVAALSNMDVTSHWGEPVYEAHIFNDSSEVGGFEIDVNVENHIYNLLNILPTFNPVDAPTDITVHQTFGYTLEEGEYGAYWDDSIPGTGIVSRVYSGPRMTKCTTAYKFWVGNPVGGGADGPDNGVFNQEIGSCFGSVSEPPTTETYVSVFTDPNGSMTYSEDDLNAQSVYFDRGLIHYRNLSYDKEDPEGWDWELHPNLVDDYYNTGREWLEYIVYGEAGEVKRRDIYLMDDVPLDVMKNSRLIFSEEEIRQRAYEEKHGLKPSPPSEPASKASSKYTTRQKAVDDFKRRFMQNRAIEKARRGWEQKGEESLRVSPTQASKKPSPPQKPTRDPVNPPHSR